MGPLENYLHEMCRTYQSASSAPETSYYTALENLLDAVGKMLKPRVDCVMQLQNRGAGMPDGGLFTADQSPRTAAPLPGQLPARGAIEAKPVAQELEPIARGEQVARYVEKYGQALVTNFRQFILVARGTNGAPELLESFSLADSEASFWDAALHARRTANQYEDRLIEYLQRVMLRPAPLAEPRDLAWLLASYAREARRRVEQAGSAALTGVRTAMEESLGLHFEGARGDHFFQSTLVQTLFYGIFSAWVLWHNERPMRQDPFDWRDSGYLLHVPVIQALFYQMADPRRLQPLGLMEVLKWTGQALNRVDRGAFFSHFQQEHAVQYFYEPFLEAYDPELRKELGVWYTPPEIVEYMVARVDTVLREELGLADGLADRRVYVLDPCCGTGAYLVAVLRRIAARLEQRGEGALLGDDLKEAVTRRVFGFEILPAPLVIAHLQIGLLLHEHHVELSHPGEVSLTPRPIERAGVFLTNALTGWAHGAGEEEKGEQLALSFPELKHEHDAADKVKQGTPILVVIGNPPYNGMAGVAVDEERELSNAYRTTKRAPAPQGQGLNDLYVRFFRMAERRIVEQSGQGVVCFISNYSWLDGLSFTGMRERYMEVFDRVWVDCLNGDKYKTGKLTPDGKPDPSVFSTDFNKEGIQVGTAIALLVRKKAHAAVEAVRFRHLWGKQKRAELLSTAKQDGESLYEKLDPPLELGLPFMPTRVESAYLSWPLLTELFPVSFPGVKTSRDDVVVDIDRERLERRMRQYFDPGIDHEKMAHLVPGAMMSGAGFDAKSVREYLCKRGFLAQNIVRYCYRPFDVRWLYWESETNLLDRSRVEYFPHVFEGNVWVEARQRQPMEHFDRGYVVRVLADNQGNGLSSFFPLYLRPGAAKQSGLFEEQADSRHLANGLDLNLSDATVSYLGSIGSMADAEPLFYHIVAVLHSPSYRLENAGALRQDWPRIPLPPTRELLLVSAALGRRVAALLDVEGEVEGVTVGEVRAELRVVGVPEKAAGGSWAVTAGWGHAGKGGVTMPGTGRPVRRDYGAAERAELEAGAAALGLSPEHLYAALGESTVDVYLNDAAYWRNIPRRVWEYTIGGYQVIKKWLSYREQALLGRALEVAEVREVRDMARRIAGILLLEGELDKNYGECKGVR